MSARFVVEYVDTEGAVYATIIRADDEDAALDLFAERRPDVTAIVAYPKEDA